VTVLGASGWEVPSFSVEGATSRANDCCLVVFVLNERDRLRRQLARTGEYRTGLDIVLADGGSTDGSADFAELSVLGVDTVLRVKGPPGLGRQMRMAYAWCLEAGYRGVVCMDGNDKDGPDALPRFVEALTGGCDFVQGSRFVAGGVSENLPLSRLLGIKLVHAPLISCASGFHYSDTTNGFRGFSAKLLSDERVALFRDSFTEYELHYYLAIRAARLGFRVCEIPVSRRYPAHGPVPTKITPIAGNLRVLKCLLTACAGGYDPGRGGQ
jgi:dolichol-phosphate mannosyltransferase